MCPTYKPTKDFPSLSSCLPIFGEGVDDRQISLNREGHSAVDGTNLEHTYILSYGQESPGWILLFKFVTKTVANSRKLNLFGKNDWAVNPGTPRWSDGQKYFSKYPLTSNALQKLDTKLGQFTKLKRVQRNFIQKCPKQILTVAKCPNFESNFVGC